MAGDWIKMRSDLLTHPKIVRIVSALKADKLRVIGGLHAVWSLFDAHSSDGTLEGYTSETLDDYLGWPGFAAAMIKIGWLEESGESLTTPRFDEHNGQSAKRRATETKRKREARTTPEMSASDADKSRSREEKRREEKKREEELKAQAKGAGAVTSVDLSIAMRKAGIQSQPADPRLIALAEQGVTPETVESACAEAKRTKPNESIGVGYVAKILERWAKDAAALKVAGASPPQKQDAWWATDASVTAKGDELGMKSLPGESMQAFKGRIQAAIDNGGKPPEQRAGPVIAIRDEGPKAVKPEGIGSLKSLIKTRDAA